MDAKIYMGKVREKDGGREVYIVEVRDTDDVQLAKLLKPVKNDPNVSWFREDSGQRTTLESPTLIGALEKLVQDYDEVINGLSD